MQFAQISSFVLDVFLENIGKAAYLNFRVLASFFAVRNLSIFDGIDAHAIRWATLKTSGGHGPSGFDALEWGRYLTAFGSHSGSICRTVAKIAVRLATEEQDPSSLRAYNACRLKPLDKCPGVRPIGVAEVLRRIIGRTIVSCIQTDLKQLGGNQQLCMGQLCGIELAIHSLRTNFDENEAALLIDATTFSTSLTAN